VNKLKGYGIEEVVKGNSEKSTRVIIDHVIWHMTMGKVAEESEKLDKWGRDEG
jgi:hypothetical protein